MPERVRILIVKTSSMGDLIHTLPALSDARAYVPGIRFDWVCERAFAEIPSWHPAVDTVIPINLRGWRHELVSSKSRREVRAALGRLRTLRYDYVIDAQGLIKSAIITLLSRGITVGTTWAACREGIASLAYRKRVAVERTDHAIHRIRTLFAKLLNYSFDPAFLDYGLNPKDFPVIQSQKPYIVFLHGTSNGNKLWDNAEWIALAGFAAEEGFEVLLPRGNADEYARAESLAAACGNMRILPPRSLSEIAGVLAGARGVVGLDTGLAHLTAALGIPGTTLYIATSPWLTGACGRNQLCVCTRDLMNRFPAGSAGVGGPDVRTVPEMSAFAVWSLLQEQMVMARKTAEFRDFQIAATGQDAWTD
ncbi:MAG: lipopolysaccharide heptosyltransferase I [Gammaproteobacteria bacterium]